MTDPPVTPPATPPASPPATPPPTPPTPPQPRQDPDPDDDLDGDLTQAQLATRRHRQLREQARSAVARATAAEARAQAAEQELAGAKAQLGSVTQLRQSLLEQAVTAQAAGVLAPEAVADAIKLLDLSDVKVGDDGKIDGAKIKAKVDELVKAKPYLAANKPTNGAQRLPGGHNPPPAGSGGFNDLIRSAAGR